MIHVASLQDQGDPRLHFRFRCLCHTLNVVVWLDLVKSFIEIFIRGNTKGHTDTVSECPGKKRPAEAGQSYYLIRVILLGNDPVSDDSQHR